MTFLYSSHPSPTQATLAQQGNGKSRRILTQNLEHSTLKKDIKF
jgi:hypothetical protein